MANAQTGVEFGELRLLLVFSHRLPRSLQLGFYRSGTCCIRSSAQQLIGGDPVLIGDKAWPEAFASRSDGRGLKLG